VYPSVNQNVNTQIQQCTMLSETSGNNGDNYASKLKRLVAYSRDVIVIILRDKELISEFISDDDFAELFKKEAQKLTDKIEKDMDNVMFEISSDKNKIKLSNEGLDDVHLDFKYNFINRIAIKAGLPSLDEYKVNSTLRVDPSYKGFFEYQIT